jgi:hypothetical protein
MKILSKFTIAAKVNFLIATAIAISMNLPMAHAAKSATKSAPKGASESFNKLAPICIAGEIRWLDANQTKSETSQYCFNNDRNTLVSKNCINGKCKVLKALSDILGTKLKIYSDVGNPGFNLCHEIGGYPQIIEFFDSVNWYKLNRCTFNEDQSYLDVGLLLHKWNLNKAQ